MVNWCFTYSNVVSTIFNYFFFADQAVPGIQAVVQAMVLFICCILFFLSIFIANSDVRNVLNGFVHTSYLAFMWLTM